VPGFVEVFDGEVIHGGVQKYARWDGFGIGRNNFIRMMRRLGYRVYL
jgi:hypothetical protein